MCEVIAFAAWLSRDTGVPAKCTNRVAYRVQYGEMGDFLYIDFDTARERRERERERETERE